MVVASFHPYATDAKEREILPYWFAVVAILISYGLHVLIDVTHASVPWFIYIWSPVAFYGAVYKSFASAAWRWKLWRRVGIVKIPDLNGYYDGTLTTSHDGRGKNHACDFLIKQTWTTIAIRGSFDGSWSANLVTGISVKNTLEPRLTYEYTNIPKGTAAPSMHRHDGTIWFDIKIDEPLTLTGEYYTGRDRGNVGELVLRRKNAPRGLGNLRVVC